MARSPCYEPGPHPDCIHDHAFELDGLGGLTPDVTYEMLLSGQKWANDGTVFECTRATGSGDIVQRVPAPVRSFGRCTVQ